MKTFLRLLGLVAVLNLVRYLVGGPIEAVTIMEPMHRVMPKHPEVFNTAFGGGDFAVSLAYNFVLWFAAALGFHLMEPQLRGGMLAKSLQGYGVMWLAFVSLAAVYMNHYTAAIQPFYLWSMVDAVIVYGVVALANAVLYPRFFPERSRRDPSARVELHER